MGLSGTLNATDALSPWIERRHAIGLVVSPNASPCDHVPAQGENLRLKTTGLVLRANFSWVSSMDACAITKQPGNAKTTIAGIIYPIACGSNRYRVSRLTTP